MAINPKWCQPSHVWRDYFRHWILGIDLTQEEALQTFVFFDFRPIYGQDDFVPGLMECISESMDQRKTFLRDMAGIAVLHQPPLGFFKRLGVEKSGEHKNKLNLKLNGLTPLIHAVRTLALDQRHFETNTMDRLSSLMETGLLSQGEVDDLRDAFNVILEAPTIGIGAGAGPSGQVLVAHDLLGLFDRFTPKFVKKYADFHHEMQRAFTDYIEDVETRRFPAQQHTVEMDDREWDALLSDIE